MKRSTVNIQNKSGSVLCVPLELLDNREVATVFIDGVPYHLERMSDLDADRNDSMSCLGDSPTESSAAEWSRPSRNRTTTVGKECA